MNNPFDNDPVQSVNPFNDPLNQEQNLDQFQDSTIQSYEPLQDTLQPQSDIDMFKTSENLGQFDNGLSQPDMPAPNLFDSTSAYTYGHNMNSAEDQSMNAAFNTAQNDLLNPVHSDSHSISFHSTPVTITNTPLPVTVEKPSPLDLSSGGGSEESHHEDHSSSTDNSSSNDSGNCGGGDSGSCSDGGGSNSGDSGGDD